MNFWHIHEEAFDATTTKMQSQESVFTVGNGYFCTRGTFEEGYFRATPATLLFGVFDDIPLAKEELANIPDWTSIELIINDEQFRLDRGNILGYSRTLDMKNGLLFRSVHWESPTGIRLHITSERLAHLADEHVGAIRYSVRLEESTCGDDVQFALWASLNTAVGNYDVMHWETVGQGRKHDLMWLQTETKKSKVQLSQTMSFSITKADCRKEYIASSVAPSIRFYGTLALGETVTVEKIVVMYTSRDDIDVPLSAALEHHKRILGTVGEEQKLDTPIHVYDKLLIKHQEAWALFWNIADVVIEGDPKAQLGIRYNMYQLRINASIHDNRYSIAAKGLTGFGYRGHVFHDTEIFMLPFFVHVMPAIARNLLLYRYNSLPAAREKAAKNGYKGAQYAWESTLSGEEMTPSLLVDPETCEISPVLTGLLELHITASIAHAVWQYWLVSGDDTFMYEYGAEILLSTAMFWASRVEKHSERDVYEITNVIGPDEWHEHVNNDAYTNYMAQQNIRKALDILHWLHQTKPETAAVLEQKLQLTNHTLEYWREVVKYLSISQNPRTGLFEQFDGFFQLEPLQQEKYAERQESYQNILGMRQLQKYQIIKQADVLMLLTVLSDQFDLDIKQVNWDYYTPITDHDYGSSLTPALHVILACELGLVQDAYTFFMKGALIDLENLRGNTHEGIHMACAGAVWQAAIVGFAGLRVTTCGYTTNPQWPENWTRLAFSFVYKGELISLDLHKDCDFLQDGL